MLPITFNIDGYEVVLTWYQYTPPSGTQFTAVSDHDYYGYYELDYHVVGDDDGELDFDSQIVERLQELRNEAE